jgi:hypothetical protein
VNVTRRFLLVALATLAQGVQAQSAQPAPLHPREAEAVSFATAWLDLLDAGKAEESFNLLAPLFKANLTADQWRNSVIESKAQLGKLRSRTLKRVVWYEDPANAPLPGTYVAVEFDSDYEGTDKHFQYIMLHSQRGEPFRVMRHQSTLLVKGKGTVGGDVR